MKNILIATLALLAITACATDPEYAFREGVRSQVQSNIYSVAVAFPGSATIASNLVVTGHVACAAITSNYAKVTGQFWNERADDADAALMTVGYEGRNATLALYADQYDDPTDMWAIKSYATGNALSFENNGNVRLSLSAAGALTQTQTPIYSQAAAVAPTNSAAAGLTITVNGTNYVVALFPN